ncbi:ATP-binding cassette domain-containing protein [Agromyces sp. SYSU T0242]|uniref:ATP-binding cassette domain-containing protein n=1 Tax=Agromyces litoreus TaxID=3158561 RepID=UPI00339774FA
MSAADARAVAATEAGPIAVEGVTVGFGDVLALDDVGLEVPAGRVTAVVGGDGAGKSTLLRVFANRIRPSSGRVSTLGADRLGYQPATSGVWGNLTVAENVDFVGRSYGMGSRAIRERAPGLLARAGLAEARSRLGRDLSGGMRQKLGFVLAILHEPDLVILDEPSTGVDPVSRVELWRLVSGAAASGAAVLMATTYLDEAQRASSVTALDAGRVIASGTAEEIIAAVPGTIAVLPAGLDRDEAPANAWRRGVRRHAWYPAGGAPAGAAPIPHPDLEDALIALTLQRRTGADAAPAADAAPPREAPEGRAEPTASGPADAAPAHTHPRHRAPGPAAPPASDRVAEPSGAVLADADGATRTYGATRAVDDMSLAVDAGEIVGLIGANGAGKTTFLRMLIGLERPDAGTTALFGGPPDSEARRRMGYVPQGLGLFRTIEVQQNVEFTERVYGGPPADLPHSLEEVRRSIVDAIGLGRQRQLAFALALSHGPELLVLDEPTSGVDPLARARLWDVIHEQAARGRGVIVTTHYLQEAEQCSRLALMSRGRLLGMGSVADLTAGTTAVRVRAANWEAAFGALGDAGLPTMLTGRDIRVAGVPSDHVHAALAARGIEASVDAVAPTLEETMVLLDHVPGDAAAPTAAS